MNYRNPPELTEDDPHDIIAYLSKNVVCRKKMWQKMLAIYEKRLEEYKTALEAENRKKSAVEIRFKEMEELFSLNNQEVHALMAVFLSETNNAEYGDFDINRFRSGEKVSALAKIIGVPEIEAATLLDDSNNIRKYGLVDNDLDLDRTFLAYLSGICSKPPQTAWTFIAMS